MEERTCIEDSGAETAPTVSISGGTEFVGNTAAQNGGAISVSDLTKLTTDNTTKFSFNTAATAYLPPANAAGTYPDIEFASTSVTEHLLNNYDVRFTGETSISVISSVKPLEGIAVDWRTLPSEVKTMLAGKHPQVTGILSNGSEFDTLIPVSWDVENSEYDREKVGDYKIYGNLDLGSDTAFSNVQVLNGVKAEITVTVNDPPEIVSIYKKAITSEQGVYLKPLNKKYELTGTPSTTDVPQTVTVKLNDDSIAELPVNWHTEKFDPYKVTTVGEEQTVEGEVMLPEDSSIKNPKGIIAKLEVSVTPASYKLVQAKPTEISVETYKGTTLEELNQQLEEEEKNEVSILALSGKTSKRTFAKVSLEESSNSDWETQKDVCGTYTLTASWPDNISMQRPDRPVVVHINVTVKEPLVITSTILENLNIYQGYSPENAEDVPEKVKAVLEDGSEVEVGVEWDWSFYNRDSLSNPPLLGRLTNLPRKVKQPEEEIILRS